MIAHTPKAPATDPVVFPYDLSSSSSGPFVLCGCAELVLLGVRLAGAGEVYAYAICCVGCPLVNGF